MPDSDAAQVLALYFQLDRTQWWDAGRLREAQFRQLRPLLDHAVRTVPYYRERLRDAAGDPARPLTSDVWTRLPILTRQQIQEAGSRLHSEHVPAGHGAINSISTSGSTGTPVVTLKTALVQKYFNAATLRENFWHRRDLAGKMAVIRNYRTGASKSTDTFDLDSWGTPYSGLFRTGPCVSLNIFSEPARQIKWLTDQAPDYLLSMPSNFRSLAQFIRESGKRMPPLKEVRSYGEAVDSDLPKLCREIWGAKHTSVYSTQEVGIVASQCPKRPHFHSDAELNLLEVLGDDGRPCGPGEIGRVVLTPLHNYAMPLIRYEVGDLAEVGEPCSCGRGLPVLHRILGRTRALLALPSGAKRFIGSVGEIFGKFPAVIQRQIIQKNLAEIDILLVARRQLTTAEEDALRAGLARRIGDGFRFNFLYVDGIPRNSEGKFEDFRSEVA